MKFWKRASGALKDGKSLVKASFFTHRSSFRNPDIEAAVIKATSHDESRVNYRNTQRVYAWVRISDEYFRQVLWALSLRMWRTHDWVVVLKGLMLLHGVFCCKVPGIQNIGRLPFDVMNFKDERGKLMSEFIRAYYAFLDEKSALIFFHSRDQRAKDVIWLQKLQGLLDLLIQIRPKSVNLLVLEAMDCIVIEVYDICARISNGIGITIKYSVDPKMALSILQKAKLQHQQLSLYFEFCRDIGVRNASECPKMEQISEQVVRELQQMINGGGDSEQSISIVMDSMKTPDLDNSTSLKTGVTSVDLEVFHGKNMESNQHLELIQLVSPPANNSSRINHLVQQKIVELPDLISF